MSAIIWEYHHPHPVLDVRLFKSRNFSVACIMMFMLGAALYGATVLIPQLLQTLMGYTAQQAGMVLSPGGLVIIATMPLIGRLLGKMDGRWLIVFGFSSTALALYHMTSWTLDIDFKTAMMFRVYQAIGMGFLFVPIQTLCYIGIPQEKNNNVSGMTNLARNLGGSLGISAISVIVSRRAQYHQSVLASHTSQYDSTFQQSVAGFTQTFQIARFGRGACHHHGAADALRSHAAAGRAAGLYRRHLYLFADLRGDGSRCVSDAEAAEGREAESGPLIVARLGASHDAGGTHDESIRRWADEVERITGDQRQDLMSIRLQNRNVGRTHDFRRRHAVAIFARQGSNRDHVVPPDVSQRTEQRIAVAGNPDIATLAGERRSRRCDHPRAAACVRPFLQRRLRKRPAAVSPSAPAIRWSNPLPGLGIAATCKWAWSNNWLACLWYIQVSASTNAQ